jgi:hypothetical protein
LLWRAVAPVAVQVPDTQPRRRRHSHRAAQRPVAPRVDCLVLGRDAAGTIDGRSGRVYHGSQHAILSQQRGCLRIEDQASLESIRAQIAHLHEVQRRLQALQRLPPAERESTLDAMMEIADEMEGLMREARRLERILYSDSLAQQP